MKSSPENETHKIQAESKMQGWVVFFFKISGKK